jgi:hypothetical protein
MELAAPLAAVYIPLWRAMLHKFAGDLYREFSIVAGPHEQTDTPDLQNHELG